MVPRGIVSLREANRARITKAGGRNVGDLLRLHEALFEHSVVSVAGVRQLTGKEFPVSTRLVATLEDLGVLTETTGRPPGCVYRHDRYFRLFDEARGGVASAQFAVAGSDPRAETRYIQPSFERGDV